MKEGIVLGFGNNIDYEIVWDSEVIEDLIHQYNIQRRELDINRSITSERDLVVSILSFLELGCGGERFVSSSEIIEQLAQRFAKKITLGGTSVRAAIAMRKLGFSSALHLVTVNDHVRSLIPQDSPYVCSNSSESSYPHLIVQFDQGICIKAGDIEICAAQENRLIYHSDNDNIVMNLNEDFAELITEAKVLLVSGFNAMQSETLLAHRMQTLLRMMERLPEDAIVFCEDAGYHEPRFSQIVYHKLARKLSILSLNEDELQGYLNVKLDLLDPFQVQKALMELQKLLPIPTIVVHTRHWALACGKGAMGFSQALKMAVSLATTRFCYGDDFTFEQYKVVEALPSLEVNAVFADTLNQLPGARICCVPVAHVEPAVATTVGLGDAFVGGFLPALLTYGLRFSNR
jgi:ADP-dependent phosphofructokinase/glucokinase